jgi:hypothetical protein
MPGRRSDWQETFRAPYCARDTHDPCPHLFSLGGFHLRRPRSQSSAILCRCSCHSSCPVTPAAGQATLSAKAWHSSCTCPSADLTRQRLDEAGQKSSTPASCGRRLSATSKHAVRRTERPGTGQLAGAEKRSARSTRQSCAHEGCRCRQNRRSTQPQSASWGTSCPLPGWRVKA